MNDVVKQLSLIGIVPVIKIDDAKDAAPLAKALIDGGLLPIKRWGQPEDIASAVLTLTNGSLPYVTGQSVDVDGGFHIRRL